MPSLDNNLHGSVTLTKQTGTILTIKTKDTVRNQGTYVPDDITFDLNAQTATPSFTGGAPSGTATFGTPTNCTLSNNNTSGVAVVTSGTCSRAAITYNGVVDGWVTANNGATPTGGGASNAVNLGTTTKYLTKVVLTNGKTFQIEVPNGSSGNITFTFTVDSNGNTTIT